MAMGRVYVAPTANAADIPNVLNSSPGGETGGTYFISWDNSGFTSQGWYWNDNYNYVNEGWVAVQSGLNAHIDPDTNTKYSNDFNGFNDYLKDANPSNLDDVLGNWDNDDKWEFLKKHMNVLQSCT